MPTIMSNQSHDTIKVTYTISGYVDGDGTYRNSMIKGTYNLCNAYYSNDVMISTFFDDDSNFIVIANREVDSAIHGISEMFGMFVTKKTTEKTTTKVEIKIEEWP